MPENLMPGFTDRVDKILFEIDDALTEWESVKAGEYTPEQIARGEVLVAELTKKANDRKR